MMKSTLLTSMENRITLPDHLGNMSLVLCQRLTDSTPALHRLADSVQVMVAHLVQKVAETRLEKKTHSCRAYKA